MSCHIVTPNNTAEVTQRGNLIENCPLSGLNRSTEIVWRDRGRLKRLGRVWRPVEMHANAIETKETMETYRNIYII